MQQMPSMQNDFQKLAFGGIEQTKAVELGNSRSTHLRRANAEFMANNEARKLQLQFQTKLSLPLFTEKKIKGEEGARICVAVIDANTRDVVTSGPESSIKLDVVVLEGDFNKDSEDNWAPEEFENYVAKERAGKGPLLTGDLVVKLKRGVGELGDLRFTDNSSWNRNKGFRIGLKVASGYCGNTRIQEAVTDAFRVKEHRGELYKKHYPPASDDEVWRLEKIAKNGKSLQKLSDAGIHKVEEFLLQLFTDSTKLREILGSITPTSWDVLIHHAMTCKTNWKLYSYYPDGTRTHGVVFNTDSQLIGLIKERVYFATHRLSAQEKEHGDTIVKRALDNWNDVREFNGQNGATALASPVQLQNTNFGDAMKLSVDESVRLAARQPIFMDSVNVPQGDNGIPNVGFSIQSHGNNFQNAMQSHMIHSSSQMDYMAENAATISSFQSSSTLGNQVTERPLVSDNLEILLASFSQSLPHDDEFSEIPAYYGGSVKSTSKGVHGWIKIKAVMQWGIFVRKIAMMRRVSVQSDEPIVVQA
ncbi:hypothetical protein BT93_E2424 [Corymbia citriodora subsp. variegata]|nr:hypothetical protein BT93_E2424 [Corymbia citriodora subsp. variegata]